MRHLTLAETPEEPVAHNPEIRKRVLLRDGDLPHLTQLAQARFAPGQVAAGHVHADMHEVFLVAGGAGVIRVDGAAHRLAPGVCVAVEPGETHEIESTGGEPLVLVYFGLRS